MMNIDSNIKQISDKYLRDGYMGTIQSLNSFNDNSKEWDICYKYNPPNNILCNFSPSFFIFDKTMINSMEGFLQSLKVKDIETQRKVCQLPGFLAKKMGNYLRRSGQFDGEHLFWQGQSINRNTSEYQNILDKVYKAKYFYDKEFRETLAQSCGYTLTHKIGKTSPQETVLTEEEFINHLNELRHSQSISDVLNIYIASIRKFIPNNISASIVSHNLADLKTTFINSNILCGEDVFNKEGYKIKLLKKAGVNNVIQIDASPQDQEKNRQKCRENGLSYFCFNFNPENYDKCANEDLKNLIDIFNKNEISYICCNQRQECNPLLALNFMFNPKAYLSDAIMFGSPRKRTINNLAKIVMNHITPETKMSLGWNEKFEKDLNDRKKVIYEINE